MAPTIALLDMTRRRIFWLGLLAATFVVSLCSYWWPPHTVAPRRVVIGGDSNDSVRAGPSQAKTGYAPYASRVNVALPYFNVTGVLNTANPGR